MATFKAMLLAGALLSISASEVLAQETLLHQRKLAPVPSDVCATVMKWDASKAYNCGNDNLKEGNRAAAMIWYERAIAQPIDPSFLTNDQLFSAHRMADMYQFDGYQEYEQCDPRNPRRPGDDAVAVYQWYYIAALVHGEMIDAMPPVKSRLDYQEDNREDLACLEAKASHMTATEITRAKKLAQEWWMRRDQLR